VVLAVLAALSLTTCGRGKNATTPASIGSGDLQAAENFQRVAPPIQMADSLDDALAELGALETPEGVDEALFEELKDALSEALLTQVDYVGGAGVPPVIQVVRRRDACATSGVPTGEANRVTDLELTDIGDGTYTLVWSYENVGDYDQNGTANVEDIVPLAVHYGESYEPTDVNCLLAVIDGSGNGSIGIADITPIARKLAVNVHHYLIEGAQSTDGPWEAVDEVAQDVGSGEGRLTYEYVLNDASHRWYRVAPCDSESVFGEASNMYPAFQKWVHTWGGTHCDAGSGVAVDASGNAYTTGHTWSSGAGKLDVILLKYSSAGALLWQRTWGESGHEWGLGVMVDGSGNVYLVGYADSACGSWQDVCGTETSPSGTVTTPDGSKGSPGGTETSPSGTVTTPDGVEDIGGGRSDVLIMKIDPSQL